MGLQFDPDGAIARLGGDQALYMSIMEMFLEETDGEALSQILKQGPPLEVREAFMRAHSLKGTACVLGMNALSEQIGETVELLRNRSSRPTPKEEAIIYGSIALSLKALEQAKETAGMYLQNGGLLNDTADEIKKD